MSFWKKYLTLRAVLIFLFFTGGLALVVIGWNMTGELNGLGVMFLGIVLMLTALLLYNRKYQS